MSKEIQIPINEFDYFTSDGTYVGVKFRYRLKEDATDNSTSQWSELTELVFKNSQNDNISLSETNGYDFPSSISRANPGASFVWNSVNNKMMPSQIDQIISQNSLTPGFVPTPKNDLYRLSFITPENFNVGKYDIFQSWKGIAYVHETANVSAPTSSSGVFTGTLTLTGTAATIRAQTLKSYYDWYASNVDTDLPTYATEGTSVPGNTLSITGYSASTIFAIKSAATWTASGNFKNISRTNVFTIPEYVATIPENTYEFSRKMISNKVSATLVSGSSIVRLNENVATSGIVPGMTLKKISGQGKFSTDNAVISQIDYQNNLLFISTAGSETNTLAGTFTISSVSGSGSNWTATINSSSLGSLFEVGYMLGASAGTGTLGDGLVRVTSTNNATQITIQSNKQITAGTITNLTTIYKNNHGTSGYIEFVGDASTQFDITYFGSSVKHNWLTQFFCQSIIAAPTKKKDYANLYTVLSVSESQFLYTSGLGEITSATTAVPFTARISTMSMPYQASVNAVGLRIYANSSVGFAITSVTPSYPSTGKVSYASAGHPFRVGDTVIIAGLAPTGYNGTFTITDTTTNTFAITNATTTTVTDGSGTASSGSLGSGEVKVARYVSGNSIDIVSTAAITNGFVYGIRL